MSTPIRVQLAPDRINFRTRSLRTLLSKLRSLPQESVYYGMILQGYGRVGNVRVTSQTITLAWAHEPTRTFPRTSPSRA